VISEIRKAAGVGVMMGVGAFLAYVLTGDPGTVVLGAFGGLLICRVLV